MNRNHIRIADTMYKAQESLKSLFGREYDNKILKYKAIIKGMAKTEKCKILEATMKLIEKYKENGFIGMAFLAAAVEILESKK